MNNWEKKVVTTVMWGVAALVGFVFANAAYETGMTGYMKLFHKDLWDEAAKTVLENQ